MKRLIISSILVALLTACGGGDDGGDEDPTSTATPIDGTATGQSTVDPNGNGQAIGEVENADGDAFVNEERANQNLDLRTSDRISTGSDSSIDFLLSAGPRVECKTLSDSELVLRPDAQTQIQWTSRTGVSYCNVDRDQPVQAVFGIDPDVEIEVEGTIFGVVDDGTVRVVEGFVILRAGGTEQRLGPNQQVSISSSGQPGDRGTWEGLPAEDQEVVDELRGRRTPPSPMPSDSEIRQSPLLNEMLGRGSVLVLLDDSADGGDEDFVWSYFGRLTDTWQPLQPNGDLFIEDVQRVSRQEAEVLLQQHPNAVYVAPPSTPAFQVTVTPTATSAPQTPTAVATTTAVATATATRAPALDLTSTPFYIDGSGRAWGVMFPVDQPAVAAFGRFTRAILTTGEYFELYSSTFGGAPPYDELLAIIP